MKNTVLAALVLSVSLFAAGLEEVGRLTRANGLSGSEISTYIASQKMLVTTSGDHEVFLISLENPEKPQILESLNFKGEVPCVSTHRDFLAIAEMNNPKTSPGTLHLYKVQNRKLNKLKSFTVGAHPDMVAFAPDGKTLLVANEGEPDDEAEVDPEGSISLIDI